MWATQEILSRCEISRHNTGATLPSQGLQSPRYAMLGKKELIRDEMINLWQYQLLSLQNTVVWNQRGVKKSFSWTQILIFRKVVLLLQRIFDRGGNSEGQRQQSSLRRAYFIVILRKERKETTLIKWRTHEWPSAQKECTHGVKDRLQRRNMEMLPRLVGIVLEKPKLC